LDALGIGPGDEVIVPPYTFAATVNVVLLRYALPVFVDTDRSTFQIDAGLIESAITDRTRCIIPVHLGGNCADMDTIQEVTHRKGILVLEDACQAHLAEWRKRKVGTLGALGCFSFQASKNLNCGEGGAVSSQDGTLAAHCASFHNVGRGYTVDANGSLIADPNSGFSYVRPGDNRRITEFQGALLIEQLTRLEKQAAVREANAEYLTERLSEVPGISPAEMYDGCTRNAYHLYMFRYEKRHFKDLSRNRFVEALEAEGIPCFTGYTRLNEETFLAHAFESRGFRRIYPRPVLNEWRDRSRCPENDLLCSEAVWLGQTQLLGPRRDMDDVVAAVEKIYRYAEELVAAA
jgi:dTDP-4-amino-4,6-dideoxygalactose transaminase